MKPGRLYIKIFLSFVVVLIITEILILGVFVVTVGRSFRDRYEQYAAAQLSIAKQFIEERIKSDPERPPAENDAVKDFIQKLGDVYEAKVWLSGANGTAFAKSYEGDIPVDVVRKMEAHGKDFGSFRMYRSFRKHGVFCATAPVELGKGETGAITVLFEKPESHPPMGPFVVGLLLIGAVIALLVIPVSRLITRPVKSLSDSALKIAAGDLSHRAHIKSKNEIGELGRSFNRMADALERMIRGGRELTANVSHELRTPLARIAVAESLISERLERGEYKDLERLLNHIREDITELDQLIDRILALSKLDIHETTLNVQPLDLPEMINERLERLRPAMDKRNLQLKKELSFDPPFYGDRETLQTALSNVLENAVKFSPEKGTVTVKVRSTSEGLDITVTNTFEVVPDEDLLTIFEAFNRREGAEERGYGLGLAITKRIVEKHGGRIRAVNGEEGFEIQIIFQTSGRKRTVDAERESGSFLSYKTFSTP